MAKQLFTNNAISLLASDISSSATALTVLSGMGALYPQPGQDEFFLVTLEDQAASIREIVKVTGRSGDVFTVERGQEDTIPVAWGSTLGNDTIVDHRLTAGTLTHLASTIALPPGSAIVDSPIESIQIIGVQTSITLPSDYVAGSTSVYVGGLRQKRGFDFIEYGPAELRLQFALDLQAIDDGTNVVVDYVAA